MTIYVNSIMDHLATVLKNDPLTSSGSTIEVGVPLNKDQHVLPWIGIMNGPVDMEGSQIAGNQPQGWDYNLQIAIFHQSYSEIGSGDTTYNLMIAQSQILAAVSSNTQLDGATLMLNTAQCEYYQGDDVKESFLTNMITLNYTVRGS